MVGGFGPPDAAGERAVSAPALTGKRSARRLGGTVSCALALALVGIQGAQAGTPLRVGIYPDAPLVFLDAKGVPQGVYVDLLEHIAPQEGWQLEYVSGSWEEGLARLRNGRLDLLTAIAYTEDRARAFDFNRESVVVNWGQVYVPPKSPIVSLLDLAGRRLAVVREDIYYDTFKRISAVSRVQPQFIEVEAYEDTLRLVTGGKADAALLPRLFAVYHEREYPVEKTTIMFSPSELRFAAPKDTRRPILDALDRHLAQLKADKRSVYHRSMTVWIEGVHTLIFPKWLRPGWVLAGIAALVLWIGGMNLILRWRVRVKTDALRETLAVQERIESELRVAHNIQMGSVRRDFPSIPGYEMDGVLQPARAVGGDFYDWFLVAEDRLCFVLGDVSGKGVPAALLMAATKTLLNATGLGNPHPKKILEAANRQIARGNDACMFVTAFCGILDVRTGAICYSNAGHDPPFVLRAGRRLEYVEGAGSSPIGIDEETVYEEAAVTLHPGDALFMYTDGVTESRNVRGDFFAEKGLTDALTHIGNGSARGLVQETLERVRRFAGDAPQADDIAVLAIRHTEEDGKAPASARWSLACDLAELAGVSERVIGFGGAHGLPDEVTADVRLVLEEVLSNIIRHGYAGRREGKIHVQMALDREAITLEVEDEGAPFDPTAHPEPNLERPFGERAPGGLGVHLVRTLMDEVTYRREGERNVLGIVKRLPGGTGPVHARPPDGPVGGDRRPSPRPREEAEMSLTVTLKEHGMGLFTVYPAGSLDSNTYQVLESRLQAITAMSPRSIIFDLKDLSYISSAGVRVILAAKKALKATGGDVILTNLQPQIRKVFDIIKAIPSLSIFESVEELDRYLDKMQKKVTQGGA